MQFYQYKKLKTIFKNIKRSVTFRNGYEDLYEPLTEKIARNLELFTSRLASIAALRVKTSVFFTSSTYLHMNFLAANDGEPIKWLIFPLILVVL